MRRAAHQLFDNPKVFEDPVALRIAGPEAEQDLFANLESERPARLYLRAFMAVRSRVAEDQLTRAIAHGAAQYVLLGAGLDTFAYRNPPPALRVFEVDHPATQTWKRERLREMAIAVPDSVVYAPIDFERQQLAEGLEAAGLDFNRITFFAWLGVVPYLTAEAATATLRFIAAMPRGSGVTFDYSVPPSSLNGWQRAAFDVLAARVAAAGEPFQLFFEPAELAHMLMSLGFSSLEDLDGRELNERYFHNRTDGLRTAGGAAHIMTAWV
jgi:methyltransferase (TIGR00027 family)